MTAADAEGNERILHLNILYMETIIRAVHEGDSEALRSIYRPYVEQTAVTFEWDVPSAEEFRRRIAEISAAYPYLVAERGGEVVGYAYASAFQPRRAYAWSAETSIYLRQDCRGQGLGRLLHGALREALRQMNVQTMYACISSPCEAGDPYLTDASIRFHSALGYRLAGTFHRCGYKLGRWYDMVWMELPIGDYAVPPAEVKC